MAKEIKPSEEAIRYTLRSSIDKKYKGDLRTACNDADHIFGYNPGTLRKYFGFKDEPIEPAQIRDGGWMARWEAGQS